MLIECLWASSSLDLIFYGCLVELFLLLHLPMVILNWHNLLACGRFTIHDSHWPLPPTPLLLCVSCLQNQGCVGTPEFLFSTYTEWTASRTWKDIHWIWQKVNWIKTAYSLFNPSTTGNRGKEWGRRSGGIERKNTWGGESRQVQ